MRINVIPVQQALRGATMFGPVAIPLDLTKVSVWISRAQLLDPALGLSWSIMLSLDGGVSWRSWGGAGTVGGVVLNAKTGLTEPESGLTIMLPEPTNPDRQIEGVLVLSKSARLSVAVEFT